MIHVEEWRIVNSSLHAIIQLRGLFKGNIQLSSGFYGVTCSHFQHSFHPTLLKSKAGYPALLELVAILVRPDLFEKAQSLYDLAF